MANAAARSEAPRGRKVNGLRLRGGDFAFWLQRRPVWAILATIGKG
jgi:hypothetical protein